MVYIVASDCVSYPLTADYFSQTATLTCDGGSGELYLNADTQTSSLVVTSTKFQTLTQSVAYVQQFQTLVQITMILNPVTITLNDISNTGLQAYADNTTVTVDSGSALTMTSSTVTFTPATESYVLRVVYQGLQLFN